jgi:hypothetical protein
MRRRLFATISLDARRTGTLDEGRSDIGTPPVDVE